MARIIGVCNQKGGVGKTTTAVNLSASLALLNKKTLLVDFDPQANASSALGIRLTLADQSIYHGVAGVVPAETVVKPSALSNLHILPSNAHLAGLLVELVNVPDRELYLRKFLSRVRHAYDYVFIDLPPSLSLLTINGLIAADEVIIPVQCEYYSLEGLGQLLETLHLVKDHFGHNIKVAGAVLTMYDKRERLSREVAKELRTNFPHTVFETEIPRSVSLAEAPSFSKPISLYNPQSPGSIAYDRLAQELTAQETMAHLCSDADSIHLYKKRSSYNTRTSSSYPHTYPRPRRTSKRRKRYTRARISY